MDTGEPNSSSLTWMKKSVGRFVTIRLCAIFLTGLSVYGELMDALHAANRYGLEASPFAWSVQVNLLEYLETIWEHPDQGIWEIRGEPRRRRRNNDLTIQLRHPHF